MRVEETELPGVLLLAPRVFSDERGVFFESWREERYAEAGLPRGFVQDNVSVSAKGVLRGLHFQHPHAQGKLVYVVTGEVWDVAVDIRRGSPHFGQWTGHTLSADNRHQLYIPPGFAHGFVVTSDQAAFCYKCTESYHPGSEGTLLWNDPAVGIEWPVPEPILSAKDTGGSPLGEFQPGRLPAFTS